MASGLTAVPLAGELLDVAQACGLDLGAALQGDDDALRPTDVAQPALFLVETVLAHALPAGLDVVAVAGHSVGELAAGAAAGAMTPAAGMRLVIERGRAMASMREGTMSALLGIDVEVAGQVCEQAQRDSGEVVVVANMNAPGQTVISGTRAAVEAAASLARARGARRAVPLNVSGAFHSPLMRDAAERFAAALEATELGSSRLPVVCNVDAEAVTDASAYRDRLRRQLTAPVRWIDCVERMIELGVELLVEVGPGAVLTGLARRIAPATRAVSVSTLEQARSFEPAPAPA